MANIDLTVLLAKEPYDIDKICHLFNESLVPQIVQRINQDFSPFRLVKQARKEDPLPTDKRQLSSYRTRMGTILEYALSTGLHSLLKELYGNKLLLTFAVAHEYPDFYLRDENLLPILRIEMKSVDADSDEQAARFDMPTISILPNKDLLLLIAWEWKTDSTRGGEYPEIFSHLVLPAIDIARERDRRCIAIGGKIEGDKVFVPSTKNRGEMVSDPGNYGKFWRIISRNRRGTTDFSPHIKRFEEFLKKVDERCFSRGARTRRRYSTKDIK